MYEFLVGSPPFNDDTVEKIFDNIRNMKMEWPEIGKYLVLIRGYDENCISPNAYDLI